MSAHTHSYAHMTGLADVWAYIKRYGRAMLPSPLDLPPQYPNLIVMGMAALAGALMQSAGTVTFPPPSPRYWHNL